MATEPETPEIPEVQLFDGELARRGYALNKLCFSLNHEENRQAFLADEAAYLDRHGVTGEQRRAVEERDVLGLLAAGGNIYYLAKLAGVLGLGVQDLGAMQTGTTVEDFTERLAEAGRQVRATGPGRPADEGAP